MPSETNDPERERRRNEILAACLEDPRLAADLLGYFADEARLADLARPAKRPIDHILAASASCEAATIPPDAKTPADGTRAPLSSFGDYDLLEEVGRGGMGVVYKAYQKSLKRIVALKMILAGSHAGAEQLARFRAEAEAVAHLQHANIVQIYEVGTLAGLPFFSLEFVEGQSLAQKLDGTPWPPQPAARMIETLALAIHSAHQRDIVHRDLKPGNVLLQCSPVSPRPDSEERVSERPDYIPKITDFGLAKRLDAEGQTQTGAIVGTPSYMAPEQAEGKNRAVGPAADTYALGAVLYELLAGRPPFKAATPLDTIVQVATEEPVSPRLLQPHTPRDLETVCLKCLQKDPARRYASARELAEDLGRFLRGEPVRARPVGPLERVWRWCRRRPSWAALFAVLLLSVLSFIVYRVWYTRQLEREVRRAVAAEDELQQTLTRLAVERLENELGQISAIVHPMSATLTQRADWNEAQLEAWLKEILGRDARLFGTCVAFEPFQFRAGEENFALYVSRKDEKLQTKVLRPPVYPYRDKDWYRKPMADNQGRWSEPFFDEGAGDIDMITYSLPFHRDRKRVGIVTVDLSVEWLSKLTLGPDSYVFLVSEEGKFIRHPNPEYQTHLNILDVADEQGDAEFRELAERILDKEEGKGRGRDPWSGKRSQFRYAPVTVGKTRWSFVAVIADPK